ncbi:hypothetical protein FB45DRAFT_844593 [Roridomyces roridus]|uniref:BTB domain-containing protein n=1 Tax=Roridomyces roridus TaxID=1738132 RepID=A0AAD7FCC5_9AGAR|nr:hypothetical protein FB45DRAFT_844593 [Roridomyces roridus]
MDLTVASLLTQVEELWFSDGTLVIQAGTKLFRVAGGILAARSSVFKDMLAIPQPPYHTTVDGCPIVFLHDSPEDFECFLRAIFDSSFFERPPARTTALIVTAILRLSTKYDIGYLRQRALLHLASASPLSLDGFRALSYTSTFSNTHLFSLLMTADSLGLEWAKVVPMFGISCFVDPEDILSGVDMVPGQPKLLLSPSLQRTCIRARTELVAVQMRDTFSFIYILPVATCESPAECRSERDALRRVFTAYKCVNPFLQLHPTSWDELDLCVACLDAAKVEFDAALRRVWEQFPGIFGLGSWEQLRGAKESDLAGSK